jgi:hypothetical protein
MAQRCMGKVYDNLDHSSFTVRLLGYAQQVAVREVQ